MGKKFSLSRISGIGSFCAFLVLFLFLTFINPDFLSTTNLTNIARQSSLNGIVAIGMTVVILTGGIDLSVGSVVGVASGLVAKLAGCGIVVVLLAILVVSAIFGLVNGILVTKAKLQPFIATLSTMMAIRGIAYLYIGDKSVSISRDYTDIINLSKINVAGIPLIFLIMVAIILVFWYVFQFTAFGRNIYSTGGNEEAAKMMGLNPQRIKITSYVICSLLAGLTGLFLASRLGSAQPTGGEGFEMDAISTVVLGGVYLTGGRGKIQGVFWAILTMGLFSNLFNMLKGMTASLENIIMGLLLIGIVLLQSDLVRKSLQKLTRKISRSKKTA